MAFLSFVLLSALNGCYGIPWVHYKGRQGDFYILVRLELDRSLAAKFSNVFMLTFCNWIPGHGHARAEPVGCLEHSWSIVR